MRINYLLVVRPPTCRPYFPTPRWQTVNNPRYLTTSRIPDTLLRTITYGACSLLLFSIAATFCFLVFACALRLTCAINDYLQFAASALKQASHCVINNPPPRDRVFTVYRFAVGKVSSNPTRRKARARLPMDFIIWEQICARARISYSSAEVGFQKRRKKITRRERSERSRPRPRARHARYKRISLFI